MKTLFAAALLASAIVKPAFADVSRFRAASTVEPAIGRYAVVLSENNGSDPAVASDLARIYGGRVEASASRDGQGAIMILRQAQARTLSADSRVLSVMELGGDESDPTATPPSPPSQPSQRTPRSDWTTTTTLWDSGAYAYDGAGNITKIGADAYRYDGVGRLTFATAGTASTTPPALPANQESFRYDRYGNLTSITMTTAHSTMVQGFAVDPSTNQLGTACAAGVDGCFTGVYDPATGNQLGRATSGEYIWDAAGMMTELHTARAERYVYDANDERILVIDSVSGHQRYVLRNGDNKVARELTFLPSSNQWTLAKDYVYRGGTLMASFSGAQTTPDRHYHVDHLGTTRVVTDASGFRLALHTYWPFGPEADGSESDTERLKFTGHERDSTLGTTPGFDLDYMHARFYDANAGRFLTVDPTWVSAGKGDPQSWNRYSYVDNNPLNGTDPDGRCPKGRCPYVPKQIHGPQRLYNAILALAGLNDPPSARDHAAPRFGAGASGTVKAVGTGGSASLDTKIQPNGKKGQTASATVTGSATVMGVDVVNGTGTLETKSGGGNPATNTASGNVSAGDSETVKIDFGMEVSYKLEFSLEIRRDDLREAAGEALLEFSELASSLSEMILGGPEDEDLPPR